jgi:hypothetical protein
MVVHGEARWEKKVIFFFFPLSFAFSPSTLKIELTTLPNLGFQKVKV